MLISQIWQAAPVSWLRLAVLNLLTLRLVFYFNQEHVLKSSDPPLPSYPGFLKLLSPRCSVLRSGLKSPGWAEIPWRSAAAQATSPAQKPNQHRLTLPGALTRAADFLRDLPYLFTCRKWRQGSCTYVPRLVWPPFLPGRQWPAHLAAEDL